LGLTFKVEVVLFTHILNGTYTLNIISAPSYILHIMGMKIYIYELNILFANVTNLVAINLQLFPNIYFILFLIYLLIILTIIGNNS